MIEDNWIINLTIIGVVIVTITLFIYAVIDMKKKVFLEEKTMRGHIIIMIFLGYFVVPGLTLIMQQIVNKTFFSTETLIGLACLVPEAVAVMIFLKDKLKFKMLKRTRSAEKQIYEDRFKT